MTRIFRRGELRSAVLDALGRSEPANGYAIMQVLAQEIGGVWKPSPGAVYPAIVSLAADGLVIGTPDDEGTITYRLTEAGRTAMRRGGGTMALVRHRSESLEVTHTVGSVLDGFAAGALQRGRRIPSSALGPVEALLAKTILDLNQLLDKEQPNG